MEELKRIYTKSPPYPPDTPVWLKVLYLFYKYLGNSPLRVKEMWQNHSIRCDIEQIPIKDIRTFHSQIGVLYRWTYLYRFGEVAWIGYAYMVNMKGLEALRRHGLISKDEEDYARMSILTKLSAIDEKRYRRVVASMKKR